MLSADALTVSVVMPVHAGIEPSHLALALASIAEQTRRPDEVVLVIDGPLPEVLLRTVDEWELDEVPIVLVRLVVNGGAGVANQAGLLAATGDLIAKADADDISLPTRLETQVRLFEEQRLDVLGGAMVEFGVDETDVLALRGAPLTHADIARRARMNNPFNHPTTMYRRRLALDVGGYPDLRYMQDYVLFGRMLAAGARGRNLAEPLVLFRAGAGMLSRRRATEVRSLERVVQEELARVGLIGPFRRWFNVVVRSTYRRLPTSVMAWAHRHLLGRARGQR